MNGLVYSSDLEDEPPLFHFSRDSKFYTVSCPMSEKQLLYIFCSIFQLFNVGGQVRFIMAHNKASPLVFENFYFLFSPILASLFDYSVSFPDSETEPPSFWEFKPSLRLPTAPGTGPCSQCSPNRNSNSGSWRYMRNCH